MALVHTRDRGRVGPPAMIRRLPARNGHPHGTVIVSAVFGSRPGVLEW